ncbi:MAG TPA: amidohydrolase [Geomonas sp.]|nr:amidohydrolase [Geomonas sp.]
MNKNSSERPRPASLLDSIAATLQAVIGKELPSLVQTYRHLHANPELAGQEANTSRLLADELKRCGCRVTEGIGRYQHENWPGYGVIGVLENGEGPTVLVRGDMDALPVEEKTGLPYASKARGINRQGAEVPVMHACGHDVHVTALIGVARVLAGLKDSWKGTLVVVGQPAEEGTGGAVAMLEDGAYRHCPRPDYALALHATLQLPAGSVGYVPGDFMSSLTEVEVIVRGVGSHGSAPELGKDPIVMAAQLVLALQTVVSREKDAFQPAVLTVGTIHGGSASNVIPEEVRLMLSIRTYDDELRDRIVASVERMAKGIALAAGVPEEKAPSVRVTNFQPPNYNDPELTERIAAGMKRTLGEARVIRTTPVMVSEDFGAWGLGGEIPTCMFWLGGADPALIEERRGAGEKMPSLHSPHFAPVPEPTLRGGVLSMVSAVLELLGR